MSEQSTDNAPQETLPLSHARILGRVVLGIILGVALFPALLELLAIAGNVSPFKYQGF